MAIKAHDDMDKMQYFFKQTIYQYVYFLLRLCGISLNDARGSCLGVFRTQDFQVHVDTNFLDVVRGIVWVRKPPLKVYRNFRTTRTEIWRFLAKNHLWLKVPYLSSGCSEIFASLHNNIIFCNVSVRGLSSDSIQLWHTSRLLVCQEGTGFVWSLFVFILSFRRWSSFVLVSGE